jgi:syntaxin 1B/2/3
MVELGEIFRELDTIVQRQGVFVTAIEHDGEITHKNVEEANTQIARANENARSRNRTKWWCLLISLLVVAAVALVVALVTRP